MAKIDLVYGMQVIVCTDNTDNAHCTQRLSCTLVVYFSCPRTCANFKALCTGKKVVSETTGVRLSYSY